MADEMTKEQKEALDKAFEKNVPNGFQKVSNEYSNVKKVIGVLSGKGGVGKSLVTSLLAVKAMRSGKKTAILDADITGPSIPKAFGIHGKTTAIEAGILPVETKSKIKLMSINVLVDNENEPVIWRGPVIAGAVTQFWTDVVWGDVDIMFVDMPPGTGDVPLTVFQSLPIDGIIVVTSPQELVEMIVSKAVIMAEKMNIPILGLVENMSYFECPDCGKKHEIFGKSRVDEIASAYGIGATARMPIIPQVAEMVDKGQIEDVELDALDNLYNSLF